MKVNDGGTNYVLEEQRKYYCLFLNLSESSFYFLIYLFKQYKKITFQASLVHTHTHTHTHTDIFLLQNWDRINHTVLTCFFPFNDILFVNNLSTLFEESILGTCMENKNF